MGFENGKLVRVVLQAVETATGDEQVTTLHYDLQDATGFDANDPQLLADAFRDDVVPDFAAMFSSLYSIQPVLVEEEKDPLNPLDPRSSWSSGTAVAGTKSIGAQELLPRACCGLASVRTALVGRRFRGRIFIPGTWTETDQAAGIWAGTATLLMGNFLDAIPRQPDIVSGVSDSTANWCVYSRTQRAANLDPYAEHVTDVIRRDQVHWLRSRQPF